MSCGIAQSRETMSVGMATRRASLHHLDLATHPGAGMLDRLTRARVLRLSRLEQVKDVLRARGSPKSEKNRLLWVNPEVTGPG